MKSQTALLLLLLLAGPPMGWAAKATVPEWPLQIDGGRAPIMLYQPQPESFVDDKLTARAAVSIKPEGKDPVFGAVWIGARVATDREARTVTVKDIAVTRARFAGATPEREQLLSTILTDALSKKNFVISLDRLLVSLESSQREMRSVNDLKMDPPKIYIANKETALIILDGEPQIRSGRVVNTPYEVYFSSTSKLWRIKLKDQWVSAPDLKGPWKDESNPAAVVPDVIVSKEPAELIVSKGEPDYVALPDNQLLYMKNTDSDVFVETATSKIFILISGRWYTTSKLEGPWIFVQPNQLPAAFSRIPPESPKGSVLASVSGTTASQEALLDLQIPQTMAVSRKDKDGKLQVQWDGKPQFEDLEGIPVSYSENSSIPVFKVGKEGYFACTEGIWYASKNPTGPWIVASYVPKEISLIPPSCPYYNTKYVHVFDSDGDTVYVGYYPGYVGSYPYNGAVVYGTGYPGMTVTFGFGFSYYPYYGWGGHPVYPIYPGGGWGGWGPGGRPGDRPGRGDHVEHHDKGRGDRNQSARPETRNNVYADRDGNVSRRDQNGHWQDRTSGGWKDNPSPRQDVQRDSQARDRGAQRASQYSGASRPSYSGGGMRGGGMRGGGGRR